MNQWELIKGKLASVLPNETFLSWVQPTRSILEGDGTIHVSVPDEQTRIMLQEDYLRLVESTTAQLGLGPQSFHFQVERNGITAVKSDGNSAVSNGHRHFPPQLSAAGFPPKPSLIERYTFENFVVGPCNQFAHAASQAVASRPSGSYNPLFIYGGTGIGKTHLMHAIGLALGNASPGTRIVYTSSERFVNDMVTCIKTERMPSFHSYYRSADVLLVDDIHIIAGKERTQEEFFHTFNDLYEHKKQIVISSDSAPNEITGLVDRLRSRFEWGLMVDMQPPDLETKMAILDKKAEADGVTLPEDVRIFIATKTKSSVRELEGALVKVLAYSSMVDAPITLQMARQVLSGLGEQGERRVSIDSIQKAVASKFKLQQQQLRQRSNAHSISYPRQVAMFLAKELTAASLTEIGRAFGGKHHTTVMHSVQKIEGERQANAETAKVIQSLIDSFH
ncbi:MAG: chromosomal replication initiator protein DnaA [Bryobacterales bacterium]|nr:chromosomal replication initiator protein DnaA [Bryobacterales bacterium]